MEILRGIANVLFVMLIAGGVAYVGDRVGHQVGRKRLTLYGIRPRYTSTIIAIATGMIIALVVTLVAIFASQEVKIAFFQLNTINQQIAQLQTRERNLEAKVNSGRLVWPVDQLMAPFYRLIKQHATPAERLSTIRTFYFDSVKYINANYPSLGLKPYAIPPDVDKKLAASANDTKNLVAKLEDSDVMLTATSDQNLFANDQIHFGITETPDKLGYRKGQIIAQLKITGKTGASANIALGQLTNEVSVNARGLGLPGFLADNVQPLQLLPAPAQMQQMLAAPGAYLLTAFAAEDFYPHIGGIPIIIVLTKQPGV
ncbi:MAG TPA: DUF3084 domain-containing protein [Candidatus Baltobacteraceae bacterium]|nr:DUF3084 domain-containing protein [Candidatus Baltobacteraceae bacterium]